jgi:hypothetical protein
MLCKIIENESKAIKPKNRESGVVRILDNMNNLLVDIGKPFKTKDTALLAKAVS